jgi:predicted nucleic acid-binding Zn ribbon protein
MPATDFTQNRSESSELKRLAAEAKEGSSEALGKVWEALIPLARQVAARCWSREIEDLAQELLLEVPTLLRRYPNDDDRDMQAWFRRAFENHAKFVGKTYKKQELMAFGRSGDYSAMDELTPFEFEFDLDCCICGKKFRPRDMDQVTCTRGCTEFLSDNASKSIVASDEALAILGLLRASTVVSHAVIRQAVSQPLQRLTMLRVLGFEISWLGRDGFSLIAEPTQDESHTLREQLALQRFQGCLPSLSCMVCGEIYETTPGLLASSCSDKCRNKIQNSTRTAEARNKSYMKRKAAK